MLKNQIYNFPKFWLRDFWQSANSVPNKDKSALPPRGPKMLSSVVSLTLKLVKIGINQP